MYFLLIKYVSIFRPNANATVVSKPVARVPVGTFDYQNRENYEFGKYGYGKNHVKLLHVHRNGSFHTIREYEVITHVIVK